MQLLVRRRAWCLTIGVLASEIQRCSAGCCKGKSACSMESTGRGALERDVSAQVKRQISCKITLPVAVQRKEETPASKGYAERYLARRIVWGDGTNTGDRATGVRAAGGLVCRGRRNALQNKQVGFTDS